MGPSRAVAEPGMRCGAAIPSVGQSATPGCGIAVRAEEVLSR